MTLQEKVDRVLCGKENPWQPMGNFVIVGFEVWRTVWECNPTRSGWDNVSSRKVVERFASVTDALVLEKKLVDHNSQRKRFSYETLPIQILAPGQALFPSPNSL